MDLERTNIILYLLYLESKKKDANELIYKTEIDSQKTTYGYQKGKGRDKLGIWD